MKESNSKSHPSCGSYLHRKGTSINAFVSCIGFISLRFPNKHSCKKIECLGQNGDFFSVFPLILKTEILWSCFVQLLETSTMSSGNFELLNLSPKVFRRERISITDFSLTSRTELSSDSGQWELQHSAFDTASKST